MARKLCSQAGCPNPSYAHGLCSGHASRRMRGTLDSMALVPLRTYRTRTTLMSTNFGKVVRNAAGEKQCHYCEEWQPERNYIKKPTTADRLSTKCKTCANYAAHGLSREAADCMLMDQGGKCGLCEEELSNGFHIDHDHRCCQRSGNSSCGKCVRGILCARCNINVLPVLERPDLVSAGYQYLERFDQ